MIENIFIIAAITIIGVNIATTVSIRFRRWVYSKEK